MVIQLAYNQYRFLTCIACMSDRSSFTRFCAWEGRVCCESVGLTTPVIVGALVNFCMHVCRAPATVRDKKGAKQVKPAKPAGKTVLPFEVSVAGTVLLGVMLVMYTCHCVWVSESMYSAPSIVMQSRTADGSVKHFDDFREAYAWLRCAALTSPRYWAP